MIRLLHKKESDSLEWSWRHKRPSEHDSADDFYASFDSMSAKQGDVFYSYVF